MKLFTGCLPILTFVSFLTVAHSAALKGQNEDFIKFINEALNVNHFERTALTVSDQSNSFNLPHPTAVCSTSGFKDSSDESLITNSDQDSVELPVSTDGNSESSSSEDHTESDEKTNLDKQVNMAKEEQTKETQESASEDQSSEEEYEGVDFKVKQDQRGRMMDLTRENESPKAVQMTPATDTVQQNDNLNFIDQGRNCNKISNRTSGNPDGEATAAGGPDKDQESKAENTNYESLQMCSGRKLSASSSERQLLDPDREEIANSEPLDINNSNEETDADIPAKTL